MKHLAPVALCLALAACSIYPERPQQPALHDFGPAPSPAIAGTPDVAIDAPAWLRDDRLRYRLLYNDPTLLRFYALDAWIAPPPALLAQRLRAAVDTGNYRLKLTLTDFEQVFDSPVNAHVVLNFRAATESAAGKRVGERQFHYVQACPSADAKGAVGAYAAAVEQAAGEVRAWIDSLP